MIVSIREAGPFMYKFLHPPGMEEPILLQVVYHKILDHTFHFKLQSMDEEAETMI
jgi:hypothetical protein